MQILAMASEPKHFEVADEAAQAADGAREFSARTKDGERLAAREYERANSKESETLSAWFEILLKESPYLFMLIMAIVGVAYTSFAGRSLNLYWQTLAPIYGMICVLSGWRHFDDPEARLALIWTQALHWLAFLVRTPLDKESCVLRGKENDQLVDAWLLAVL